MDKYEAFEKLKEYSKNLTSVSYNEIVDLLKNGIKFIPLPIAKLWENAFIDRVRPNKGTKLFKHIDQLGYIKDKYVIDNVLTSFGRANNPHQVIPVVHLKKDCPCDQIIVYLIEYKSVKYHERCY